MGEYRVVSWDDWEASPDGYFYFRGSEEVKEFVGTNYTKPDWNPENAYKGVILVNINAHPIRIGLDYLDGADETGEKAPKAKNITNLPETQYGGPHGYNLVNNQRLLISNLKPVDLNNEFVFDHWEVMATDREMTDDKMWGYLTGEVRKDANGDPYVSRPGMEYLLDVSMLNDLENCFYITKGSGTRLNFLLSSTQTPMTAFCIIHRCREKRICQRTWIMCDSTRVILRNFLSGKMKGLLPYQPVLPRVQMADIF